MTNWLWTYVRCIWTVWWRICGISLLSRKEIIGTRVWRFRTNWGWMGWCWMPKKPVQKRRDFLTLLNKELTDSCKHLEVSCICVAEESNSCAWVTNAPSSTDTVYICELIGREGKVNNCMQTGNINTTRSSIIRYEDGRNSFSKCLHYVITFILIELIMQCNDRKVKAGQSIRNQTN